jgi:hypothetical protein
MLLHALFALALLTLVVGRARGAEDIALRPGHHPALVRVEPRQPEAAPAHATAPAHPVVAAEPVGRERRIFEDVPGRHAHGGMVLAGSGFFALRMAHAFSTKSGQPLLSRLKSGLGIGERGLAPVAMIREGGALLGVQGHF